MKAPPEVHFDCPGCGIRLAVPTMPEKPKPDVDGVERLGICSRCGKASLLLVIFQAKTLTEHDLKKDRKAYRLSEAVRKLQCTTR